MHVIRFITERLFCEVPSDRHLLAIEEIYGDARTSALSPVNAFTRPSEANALLARWRSHWHQFGFGAWAIKTRARRGHVIGFGGITRRDFGGEELSNLWYRFRPTAWGYGYATEFGAAVLKDALARHETEIHALASPINQASIHVLEKLGFRPNGVLQINEATSLRFVFRETR
jgi:RimJ/RimL family protein N-acetyltransferase